MVAQDNNAKSADEILRKFVKGREVAQVLVKPLKQRETSFAVPMANVVDQDGTVRGTVH
jgi:hypothetical protein